MEKIALEYLVHRAKYSIGEYNVQLPNNGPEIDVLVWPVGRRQSQIQPLIMGSCKRDADDLVKQSYSPERVFGPFLQTHFDNQDLPRPKLIRYMVIAPHLSTEQYQTLERRGFEPLDLRKMAVELGFDPGPAMEPDNLKKDKTQPPSAKPKEDDFTPTPYPTPWDDDGFDESSNGW